MAHYTEFLTKNFRESAIARDRFFQQDGAPTQCRGWERMDRYVGLEARHTCFLWWYKKNKIYKGRKGTVRELKNDFGTEIRRIPNIHNAVRAIKKDAGYVFKTGDYSFNN